MIENGKKRGDWQKETRKKQPGKGPKDLSLANRQGKDPRTFEENSQEKDPCTREGRSHQVERCRVQEKLKEEKWKKREKKKKKKVKYRKVKFMSPSLLGLKKGKKERESRRSERHHKSTRAFAKFGKWLFLFLIVGRIWLSVSAAPEGPQRRTEALTRMQQELRVKECKRAEEISQRWIQPKGEDTTEM